MTNACFEPANKMMKCNPRHRKHMTCCILYSMINRIMRSALNQEAASQTCNKRQEKVNTHAFSSIVVSVSC